MRTQKLNTRDCNEGRYLNRRSCSHDGEANLCEDSSVSLPRPSSRVWHVLPGKVHAIHLNAARTYLQNTCSTSSTSTDNASGEANEIRVSITRRSCHTHVHRCYCLDEVEWDELLKSAPSLFLHEERPKQDARTARTTTIGNHSHQLKEACQASMQPCQTHGNAAQVESRCWGIEPHTGQSWSRVFVPVCCE